jgi:hypothetical protein
VDQIERFFVLLATHGVHPSFEESGTNQGLSDAFWAWSAAPYDRGSIERRSYVRNRPSPESGSPRLAPGLSHSPLAGVRKGRPYPSHRLVMATVLISWRSLGELN